MESPNKLSSSGQGSADYGYNGYGYPAAGYGEGSAQRSINDYLLILRERIWYIVVVFLVVFSSALVYTFSQTKIYESTASVQILRRENSVIQSSAEDVTETRILSTEDMNTQVKVLESATIIQKVAERITGDELRQFMAPYEKGRSDDPLTPIEVLGKNREIVPQRLSLMVAVTYKHPDRFIAAKVANYFVDEFIAYNARTRVDEIMKAVEDLQLRADQQRKKVDDIDVRMQDYREKNNLVSLEQKNDIIGDKLKQLNLLVTQAAAARSDAQIKWNQVQSYQQTGKNLAELPFIASQPLIAQLQQRIASQKIDIAQLREKYKEKHPTMVQALNSLSQAQSELDLALANASSTIEAQYNAAVSSENELRKQLATITDENFDLGRKSVEYKALERELEVNTAILQQLLERARIVSYEATIDKSSARAVDRAVPALEDKYSEPNIPLNLALGFVGGIGLGLGFAFFVAFIDDRVKSSYDIESVVGLPLIGIIPQIKKLDQPDKAQIVANNQDRQVSEAFLTLHSSLRLRDDCKGFQCFLTTSTIPGEGKSFTTTNLALTYAAHGERVVVVDCDLRKPNIHKSFRLENLRGVIDICSGTATIDDVVVKDVHPNLDVITTGGRAKNPTHILNGKAFEVFISDLRKRYDRVFVDTPPLAAVSDALIILPLVDGSVFTIFFNKVRRKAAQHAARKLLEANVPVVGAVLNGLNLAVSGYYYAQYYDKSYKDYYVVMAQQDEEESNEPAAR